MDLHASNDLRMFGGVAGVPVFSQQRGIMEIKYNDFIPKHIVSAITSSAPRMALSKYASAANGCTAELSKQYYKKYNIERFQNETTY